jgi:hypothetical protein
MREAPRHVAGSSYSTITDVIVNVPFHSKTSLQCASSVSELGSNLPCRKLLQFLPATR